MTRFHLAVSLWAAFSILLPPLTFAQAGSLVGQVIDATTDMPLPGASVYLSRTTRGTATDTSGTFDISEVTPGTYEIVASMVGYERGLRTVTVGRSPIHLSFSLRPSQTALGSVEVTARDDVQWRRRLRRFERLFFGPTPRGRQCVISNPYVLDFEEHRGAFSATARVPLTFENHALGYRVVYPLERFRAEGETVTFGGRPWYEDLETDDPKQRAKWQQARQEAYAGSFQHFLRALATGTAGDEGFDAYLLDDFRVPRWRAGGPAIVPRVPFDSLVARDGEGLVLSFDGVLHVEYVHERQHPDAPRFQRGGSTLNQKSAVSLKHLSVRFSPLGSILDPYLATTHGYWAWEGHVGDLLPLDYAPHRPESSE